MGKSVVLEGTVGQFWSHTVAHMGDFAREITGNADALAESINGMYPCRLSEPYLPDIPLYWHERIRMGGRGEGKHSHVTYLSHALHVIYDDIYDRKTQRT